MFRENDLPLQKNKIKKQKGMTRHCKCAAACCVFLLAMILSVYAKAQDKSVRFTAQLAFGPVQYFSPSNLSVVNPSACDVRSYGIDTKLGVRLYDRTSIRLGFATLGGMQDFHSDFAKESSGAVYTNLEVGFDYQINNWMLSPSIGVGMLFLSDEFKTAAQKYTFNGYGLGANVEMSLSYFVAKNIALKATLGGVIGSISSLDAKQNDVFATETLERFDRLGNYSVFVGKCTLGVEVNL